MIDSINYLSCKLTMAKSITNNLIDFQIHCVLNNFKMNFCEFTFVYRIDSVQ